MSHRQPAEAIVRNLRAHGYSAYFVGGCVRDLLLGHEPKDFDIATDAVPSQVFQIYPQAQQVGAHFGVVLVEGVEVATYRSDYAYEDGRRPGEVRYETNPMLDAARRDFTLNALFLDPETGEVLDFVDGRADLRNGVVRAIGDPAARFQEDYLRMLRAIRFAARLGFAIEPGTAGAIRTLSHLSTAIAAERVRDEIVRILTEGGARRGCELLDELGLLEHLLPEVARMKGVEQPPEYHPEGDVWTHTLIMLEGLQQPTSTLALGVLLHDVGKPPTFRVADRIRFDGHVEAGVEIAHAILTRLKFSNEEIRQVELLVANHMKFKDAPRMKESTLKKFMRLPDFDEHLELHRLDCSSSHNMFDNYEFVRAKRQAYGEEQIAPAPLLTGKDLIAAGYSPGPWFSQVLSAVEDAQLEGRIANKDEALQIASSMRQPASEPAST
ncbi:MAG TPA: CCA tRNA nucleotidyltransferase [Bryobacteraceae bacterium]|nr:CCA tRNA nucleotidyltransferase [Bryobacteraceae bacterium]